MSSLSNLGVSPLFGLVNVSLDAIIMLLAFLIMDEEAMKYLKRRSKDFMENGSFGKFHQRQSVITTKSRNTKETNDIFVIDLELEH